MGIQGLLPALKSVTTSTNVKDYAGMRAAVDTYSWLHKAAFGCSKDICNGRAPSNFINYCMHRINLLRHHGVKPLLVFDGGPLPMKADQEEKRSRSRKEHLERAHQCEAAGNHTAAYEYYQKAVDITPEIAYQLIQVLRRENVDFIVAPYEADAQLAFLSLRGFVDVVITEDSDLVAYGCPRVFFKMDKDGNGVEFQYADLVKNKELNFSNFTKRMMLEMCIFSGCDYLPSLPGMGIRRAHNLLRRFRNYNKVIKHLRFSGVLITKAYEESFDKALLTFCHHRVYDPALEDMVHLTELPGDYDGDVEFLGPRISHTLVVQIAQGVINPVTHIPFQEKLPSVDSPDPSRSAVRETRKRHVKHKEQRGLSLPAQRNVLTNYFISKSEASKLQFKAPRLCESPEVLTFSSPTSSEEDVCTPEGDACMQEGTEIYRDCKRICVQQDFLNQASEESTRILEQKATHIVSHSPHSNENSSHGYLTDNRTSENADEVGRSEPLNQTQQRKRKQSPPEPSLPKFSSKLIGEDMENLSSKVDYTERYSSIAQESIEKFAASISSFRCGARVSGLRPPLKHDLTNISRTGTADLFNQFALTSPPQTNLWRRV